MLCDQKVFISIFDPVKEKLVMYSNDLNVDVTYVDQIVDKYAHKENIKYE